MNIEGRGRCQFGDGLTGARHGCLRCIEHPPAAPSADRPRRRSTYPQNHRGRLRWVAPGMSDTEGHQPEVMGPQGISLVGDRNERVALQDEKRFLERVSMAP